MQVGMFHEGKEFLPKNLIKHKHYVLHALVHFQSPMNFSAKTFQIHTECVERIGE